MEEYYQQGNMCCYESKHKLALFHQLQEDVKRQLEEIKRKQEEQNSSKKIRDRQDLLGVSSPRLNSRSCLTKID